MSNQQNQITMSNVRCRRNFKRKKIDVLDVFAAGVRDGVYGNAMQFPAPPFPVAQYQGFIDTYFNTRAAYRNGGSAQKGPFDLARTELEGALDTMADYVDSVARGSEPIILMSNFEPTKGSTSRVPSPEQPKGVKLRHGSSGMLYAKCDNQPAVDTYLCILTANAPIPPQFSVNNSGQIIGMGDDKPDSASMANLNLIGPEFIIDFNRLRKKTFSGLTPGKIYFATFIAINSKGVSQLSAPASLMCV